MRPESGRHRLSGPSFPGKGGIPAAAELISAHPVATLLVDPEGRIVSANARAESLLNMARSALVGSPVGRVLRIDDPRMDAAIWMTDKPLSAYDIRVHAGRNEAVEMDILIHPLLDDERWRIVALHVHGQSQTLGMRRASLGARSAGGDPAAHQAHHGRGGSHRRPHRPDAALHEQSAARMPSGEHLSAAGPRG